MKAYSILSPFLLFQLMIEMTKFALNTTHISHYPAQFSILSEVLDDFGHLVYDRLLNKANDVSSSIPRLSEDFSNGIIIDDHSRNVEL